MLGTILRERWFNRDSDFFCEILRDKLREPGVRIRVIISDPKGLTARVRKEVEGDKVNRIPLDIKEVENNIKSLLDDIRSELRGSIEVRYCKNLPIYAYIIRADDKMWVTNYLCCRTGGRSPTMEIEGERSELFKIYKEEFEFLWERAVTTIDSRKITSS